MRRMFSEKQIEDLISLLGAEVAQEIIESGEVENAKPIYCHPIRIDSDDTDTSIEYRIHVALLIFDNSNEEYNTYEKLLSKLQSIFATNSSAVFPITGGLYNAVGYALHIAQMIVLDGTNIQIKTVRGNDGTQGYFGISNFSSASFYDGVNKIN